MIPESVTFNECDSSPRRFPVSRTLAILRRTGVLGGNGNRRWRLKRGNVSVDVSIAQIVTAITTVFYAAVFAIGYYMMIKGNREVLREMREERLSGGSPQIIVEASLLNLPMVELVVRHVSGGAARDITFEISNPIEDSSGYAISDLRYFREGIPLLGPGEKIRCLWDHIDRLIPYLEEKGLNEGIAVRVNYKDLTGEAYTTEWRINPLLYEGLRYDASQLPKGPSAVMAEKSPSAGAESEIVRAAPKESQSG
jgi:hypothetical protein